MRVVLLALLTSFGVLGPGCHSSPASDADPSADDARPPGDRVTPGVDSLAFSSKITIIVEPGDSGSQLLSAINGAKKSVHMTMYLLTESDIINALIARKKAGCDVSVVLNQNFSGTSTNNQTAYTQLNNGGVAVHWAWNAFTLTHEKCVIIDGSSAWIMTMNATVSSPKDNREYLAVDTDPLDVAEAEAIFSGDFKSTQVVPNGRLLVAPVNADEGLGALIDSAHTSIDIEAEELSDSDIVAKLVAASKRKVAVQIVLSDDSPTSAQSSAVTQLKAAGVKLVSLSKPYIHAKSLVVDGAAAYVGSENFTNASLFHNRELGVVFSTASEVSKVLTATRGDFASGTAL